MIDGRMHDASQYVFIPNAEYRELVRAKVVADSLMRVIKDKVTLDYGELETIRTMFGGEAE